MTVRFQRKSPRAMVGASQKNASRPPYEVGVHFYVLGTGFEPTRIRCGSAVKSRHPSQKRFRICLRQVRNLFNEICPYGQVK